MYYKSSESEDEGAVKPGGTRVTSQNDVNDNLAVK